MKPPTKKQKDTALSALIELRMRATFPNRPIAGEPQGKAVPASKLFESVLDYLGTLEAPLWSECPSCEVMDLILDNELCDRCTEAPECSRCGEPCLSDEGLQSDEPVCEGCVDTVRDFGDRREGF